MRTIGIVAETVSKWERRAPLTPTHVSQFISGGNGRRVLVQPSTRRIFSNRQFERAGAVITDDLSQADVILGIKQPSIESLLSNKTYCFFSHTIKAQKDNMPLLDAMLAKNIRLFDYECITRSGSKDSPRLVAFGRHAGRAGMINTLRGLGERYLGLGYSTPFITVSSAHSYSSFDEAAQSITNLGHHILESEGSIAKELLPIVVSFTGNGNVSKGAQEVFNLLPHQMVSVPDLPEAVEDVKRFMKNNPSGKLDRNCIIGCVVRDEDVMRRNQSFSKEDYRLHPEFYENTFQDKVAKYSTVVVTGHYWDSRYPRWLTNVGAFHQLRNEAENRMLMVSDLSCDINGGVEFTIRSSSIDDPFYYVRFPVSEGVPLEDQTAYAEEVPRESIPAVEKKRTAALMMMGVDILPSELPIDASEHFGKFLTPFLPQLAESDATKPFNPQSFPPPLAGACIVSNGKLTKLYEYISKMRQESERSRASVLADSSQRLAEGITVLRCTGHMFDTGLINQILNLIEEHNGEFRILDIVVRPNAPSRADDDNATFGHAIPSTVVLQVSMGNRETLDNMIRNISNLAKLTPKAEASIVEVGKGMQRLQPPKAQSAQKQSLQSSKKTTSKVIVFGAGMVAGPAVEYLSRNRERSVLVVSGLANEARRLVEILPTNANNIRAHAEPVDVTKDHDKVGALLRNTSDGPVVAVLSLLPPPLHPVLAKMCLDNNIPMVTSSYVSPEMRKLEPIAREKGIPILCEMGLDPGIDHMSAAKIIDECHNRGEIVTRFSSVCGGLPSPEAANNPIGYKFSWTPKGVLTAMRNDAIYKSNGKIVNVEGGSTLLRYAKPIDVGYPSLALEHIPNRNSLVYGDVYNISKEAESIYRGTLRYSKFCAIMADLLDIGLLSQLSVSDALPSVKLDRASSADTKRFLDWLGLLNKDGMIEISDSGKFSTLEDLVCSILQEKLKYGKGERDMVLMQHEFRFKHPRSGKETELSSTLLALGNNNEPGGFTAMAKTVGITAAIGVEVIAENRHKFGGGIIIPTIKDIYEPSLQRLHKEGIVFTDTVREKPASKL